MRDIVFQLLVPVLTALLGAFALPLYNAIKQGSGVTQDDKQSILGRYKCSWWVETDSGEKIYTTDNVVIEKVKGSRLYASGRDQRFDYKLEGNISRGGVVSFYYIILNRQMSLTGALTMIMNPAGSVLEGHWCGYVTEGQLMHGRVVWDRSHNIGGE